MGIMVFILARKCKHSYSYLGTALSVALDYTFYSAQNNEVEKIQKDIRTYEADLASNPINPFRNISEINPCALQPERIDA
jgi:hypothetical protein